MALRYLTLFILAFAFSMRLAASSTLTIAVPIAPKQWNDLGAGPLVVEVDDRAAQVRFAISDQSPTSSQVGFLNLRVFTTTSHVWAWSAQNAIVMVAPLVSVTPAVVPGGGNSSTTPVPLASGTGGTFGDTLGMAVTSNFVPASSGAGYRSITITNQAASGSGISATVCPVGVKDRQGNLITPATDSKGCYTFGPKGHYSAPAGGYVPQDGLNALASAPNTPVTVELH